MGQYFLDIQYRMGWGGGNSGNYYNIQDVQSIKPNHNGEGVLFAPAFYISYKIIDKKNLSDTFLNFVKGFLYFFQHFKFLTITMNLLRRFQFP